MKIAWCGFRGCVSARFRFSIKPARRLALGAAILFFVAAADASGQDRLTETPIFIQQGFGPGGTDLPDDGTVQCVTTAMSMNLAYLGNVGFTQILPANATFDEHLNLVRVLSGLSGTTNLSGTYTTGLIQGVSTYLAAKGISHYTIDSVPANADPGHAAANVQWFQDKLTDPNTVALLSVGWFQWDTSTNVYTNQGGHGMAVVGADPATGYLTVNNPSPSSLLTQPDVAAYGQQTLHTIPFTGSVPSVLPYPPYIQYDPRPARQHARPGSGASGPGRARGHLERCVPAHRPESEAG